MSALSRGTIWLSWGSLYHITAARRGVLKTSSVVITTYHVSWFCLSAFLLLNLVTGAVLNNYQLAIAEREEKRKKESV